MRRVALQRTKHIRHGQCRHCCKVQYLKYDSSNGLKQSIILSAGVVDKNGEGELEEKVVVEPSKQDTFKEGLPKGLSECEIEACREASSDVDSPECREWKG